MQARYVYTGASDSPAASDGLIRVGSDNTVLKLSRADLYLSNVKLVREDGSVWSEPESYHLLRLPTAAAGRGSLTLKDVPYGTYTGITFSFGVDEAHNH
ncbi:MbnP family protein, partial [Nostoc sp. CMAA1605]|uniref:MbnP family protein n=1 Tax=Nostoc sp. CMAA1605 TaxID=2055159 RepID=UPI001F2EEA72